MLVMIRTDASQQIGSGHVFRCLTLAETLRESGVTIEFITRNHLGNLNNQIRNRGIKVNLLPDSIVKSKITLEGYEQWLNVTQEEDAEETIRSLAGKKIDWLIIDHYALDYKWEDKLRPYTKKIMVIDDLANRSHDCDLLLDQNYIHDKYRYNQLTAPDTIKLLGPKYALLRKDFVGNLEKQPNHYHEINRVFLFFGGADPDDLTSTALQVLSQPKLKHLLVDVVIGSSNPHQAKLQNQIKKHSNVKLHIQVDNIAELMTKADIALGAGGSTTWERMAIGLPSIVVTIAENQIAFTKALDKEGYLKWLGNADQIDENTIYNALIDAIENPHQLLELSHKGKQLVDGRGVQRVSQLLTVGPKAETLTMRRATEKDSQLYWHWANDPVVRENAFSQQTIGWEEHQKWFDQRLNDENTMLLLIESDFTPIGQVRFDRVGSHFTIGYSIAKQFRGFGWGKKMLSKAIDYLRQQQAFTIIGEVKDNNSASKRVLENLGFTEAPPPEKRDGTTYFQLQFSLTVQHG